MAGLVSVFVCYRNFRPVIMQRVAFLRLTDASTRAMATEEKNRCRAKGLPCIAPLVSSVNETTVPITTEIHGHVPAWLNGSLYRNGPGKFEFGTQTYNHWFDGMALLHKFKIKGTQVTYKSHFLRSDSYKANSEHNRITTSEFGTLAMPDPCKNFFQRFLTRFVMPKHTDNASVHFVKYKGDYYVSTESPLMHRVDLETLMSKEKVDWSKFIAVNAATAHPHYDPDGTAYNMGNSYTKKGAFYNIIRVPPEKAGPEDTLQEAKVVCSIPSAIKNKPSYYHSFAMSENYVVFIEQPLKLDLLQILTGKLRGRALNEGIYWDPNQETVFHVVNKHTGEPSAVKYQARPLSFFHQINAFEEDGFLMLDLCCLDDGKVINNFLIQNLRKSGEALDEVYNEMCFAFPRRFVLPLNVHENTPYGQNLNTRHCSLATAKKISKNVVFCTHEDLHGDDLREYGGLEFPQINYARYNTRPYQYFYGCGFRHLVGDSLIKMDLQRKKFKVWTQPDFYPSEPIFVPSPGAVAEDDGVILSVVITPIQGKSTFLLILDARTFEELGRAEVPVQIPYGFHGVYESDVPTPPGGP
ncbi:carotenoid-cleaving dioxygenase, mitochondrial-like isoform X1 [Brienomyrus brachyistius]|uniref:carotenoid-cleaving dioxygenase, mitochondrial-like isoform X1 n=2 Tax=Brienomyrus brachyistius TaxID=42636 RepID=UPI0020B377A7|nr:carotenoid-cleaving dioxygenase, mitochondrial-like isoform X1 [Brienomyrus brachyistius]